jgi:hypothetical protein
VKQATPRQTWFKSSYSGGANNECVEVRFGAVPAEAVGVRDSKNTGQVLEFGPAAFKAFRDNLK